MEDLRKKFAQSLARRRGETPQAEFARKLGLIQQTYARYEQGEQMVKADVLHQMALRIGVTMEELLLGEEEGETVGAQFQERAASYASANEAEREIMDLAASLPGAVGQTKRLILDRMSQCLEQLKGPATRTVYPRPGGKSEVSSGPLSDAQLLAERAGEKGSDSKA